MSHNNAHDFFKKFNNLFEGKEVKETAEDDFSKKRADKRAAEEEAWAKSKGTPKKEAKEVKENRFAANNPEMSDDDIRDHWENKQCQADDKRKADKEDAACKALDKKDKKPSNVKETASEFYRRYADIVNEAFGDEDEEDPDVKIADKEKGKDGKTQKDADKNLPPWLKGKMDKKDKESEDKGAATTKKEKMESIQKEISDLEYQKAAKQINEAANKK